MTKSKMASRNDYGSERSIAADKALFLRSKIIFFYILFQSFKTVTVTSVGDGIERGRVKAMSKLGKGRPLVNNTCSGCKISMKCEFHLLDYNIW